MRSTRLSVHGLGVACWAAALGIALAAGCGGDSSTSDGDVGDVPDDGTGEGDGAPVCGNGEVDTGEQCDDGNATANDGCELDCTWTCTAAADDCAPDRHCEDATHTCEPGCRSDDGCASPTPLCDVEAHACVECVDDASCGAGFVCSADHECVAGCSESRPCADPLLCCDGGCIDTGTSLAHCGACGSPCAPAHATPECAGGVCTILSCDEGWDDCDGLADDGCEADLTSDPANCDACGTICPPYTNAEGACAAGVCGLACAAGWDDCNGVLDDGCETDVASSPATCGACDTPCTISHGLPRCDAGVCGVGLCFPGWGDCNDDATDGCETATSSDAANCGTCGNACTAPAHATAGCNAGVCGIGICDFGWDDCNGSVADGCESAVDADLLNCGGCGLSCAADHATTDCVTAACTVVSCETGWEDCDGLAASGCESDTQVDPLNCDACGYACPAPPHAVAGCAGGVCSVGGCADGWDDCSGGATDGCETATGADVTNCGTCGNVCPVRARATTTCTGGLCGFTCLAGWANCNGVAADGCEANLGSDPLHCGTCTTLCPLPPHSVRTCAGGVCGSACNPGWTDCNGVASDGCEIATGSDPLNCGTCGNACTLSGSHATPSCDIGVCSIVCDAGWDDCNGILTDGCEVPVSADPLNCGSCGNVCTTVPHGSTSCTSGACALACAAGWGNCNGVWADGCELDVTSDPLNCGVCGNACPIGPCAGGGCTMATGEVTYSTPGSATFVVPAGITSVSVVVVGGGGGGPASTCNCGGGGGGGLCYLNSIPVTPGASIPVVVGAGGAAGAVGTQSSFNGTLIAYGGGAGSSSGPGGAGGSGTGGTCYSGGTGGSFTGGGSPYHAGAGGAAGYAGNGGQGSWASGSSCQNNATAGSGGGGGGGGGGSDPANCGGGSGAGGGGVGLFGQGANGSAGPSSCSCGGWGTGGGGGSGGTAGTGTSTGVGGNYGGGGGSGAGAPGAVRIMWGPGRSFPSSAS
jgi:hypothetical protein